MSTATEQAPKTTTGKDESSSRIPAVRGDSTRAESGREVARRESETERLLDSHAAIDSETGTTRIADVVVAKIAGLATQEVPGVHSMGKGLARRIGAIKARVPGGGTPTASQGVTVEVGTREAAVDLEIVTWYGENIAAVSEEVRAGVIVAIESMTGLHVVEVNIHVVDIHVEGENDSASTRVQ